MAVFFLCLFLIAMIGIGLWGMRKTSSINDFFLGNRAIGPWISAFAYGTTYFSAVLFIGFAGKLGWGFGVNALWIALGNTVVGSLLAWLVLGQRTRQMTKNLDVMTMPEFLHERYEGRWIKMISATIIFIFLLPYSASVFKGLGFLFEGYFHISYDKILIMIVAITGIYLVLGGYFAITLTDLVQGSLMIFGVIALVTILTGKADVSWGEIIGQIQANYAQHVPAAKRPGPWMLASLVFMTSFGVWGLPQMVQKFYAVKSEKVILRAAIVTTIFSFIISFSAYFIGAMSHLFFDAPPIVNGAVAFDRLIPTLLTTYVPPNLMILILLLILSASMSTLASIILVAASAVAIDMYKGHLNPNISKARSLAMMRFLSGTFIALSYFIARNEFSLIITLMSLSWGTVAGAFTAPYIYGLYWKGATLWGAKAGMITGLTLGISLFFILGPDRSPMAASIAILVPFAVVPLVSLWTKKPSVHLIEKAFNRAS